ncbi:MAG: hypothetical protein ACKO96_11365, partial [Flammeovirgaceae bacterium]
MFAKSSVNGKSGKSTEKVQKTGKNTPETETEIVAEVPKKKAKSTKNEEKKTTTEQPIAEKK